MEIKNTFLRSKMNKDLDLRLVPNNEYIDALNISIGKSETQNVGSLQNILGNQVLKKPGASGTVNFETNETLICIGFFIDNEKNRIYQLLTNYTDQTPSLNVLPEEGVDIMKITVYDANNGGNPYTTLAEGVYLNFSTTNIVTGINLVENLLFWTDNRNQPRKINIDSALLYSVESGTPYYTNAEQIAVARFAPFKAATLYTVLNDITIQSVVVTTGQDTRLTILTADVTSSGLTVGCQMISEVYLVSQEDFAIVTNIVDAGSGNSYVYISGAHTSIAPTPAIVSFYKSTMYNNYDENGINGNNNNLQDKFIRFSFRFKFDDNEYSLMAPFTQPVFIPNQKGYFINGNEEAAYRSTVLEWMANSVNRVGLFIELPDLTENIATVYKIKSIDILFKESDSLAIKVVETITVARLEAEMPGENVYLYEYKSQKPRKTLQELETTRVSDRIPVKSLAQEVAGNRIIYGNFVNQNTPPASIDYNITVVQKNAPYTDRVAWAEYPNHTLKENRTYQIGVVLADKFGRQSSVILSSSDINFQDNNVFGASTIFLPYRGEQTLDLNKKWMGDELVFILNSPIASTRDEAAGTPGLYAEVGGIEPGNSTGFQITASTIIGNSYTFTLQGAVNTQRNYPDVGNYLKGKFKDYVKVISVTNNVNPDIKTIVTDAPINLSYAHNPLIAIDIKYSYIINEMGWYSYKIVVKQQEQEYYNVFTPGVLAGYPINQTITQTPTVQDSIFPTNENNVTGHFVLINDNINKIPRDLSEVGPDQKQYRSSVQLWTRVENAHYNTPVNYTGNRQYFPTSRVDVVSTIATSQDLGFLPQSDSNPDGSAFLNIYQLETNPLIARFSTINKVGVIGTTVIYGATPQETNSMLPYLSIFETEPIQSALDIFWETSTSGYISDINIDVLTGSDAVIGYTELGFLFYENQQYNGGGTTTGASNSPYITDYFCFLDSAGIPVLDITSIVFSVANRDPINNSNVTSSFTLQKEVAPGPYQDFYRIKITHSDYYFSTQADTLTSFIFTFNITHTVGGEVFNPIITTGSTVLRLSNITPVITLPAVDNVLYTLPSSPPTGVFIDCIGKNGCASTLDTNYLAGLYWSVAFDAPIIASYFSINSATGDISCLTSTTPDGTYILHVTLKDSSSNVGVQSPLVGPLSVQRIINVLIGSPIISAVSCGNWTSTQFSEEFGGDTFYTVSIVGYTNFWKLLLPGETILNTSTVTLWKVTTFNSPTPYELPSPIPLSFAQGVSYTGNGEFSNSSVFGVGITNTGVIINAYFRGYLQLSSGRSVYVDFTTVGVPTNEDNSYCETCTVSYVPAGIRGFTIYNGSNIVVSWSALAADGESIIGTTISPYGYAASVSQGGYFPSVRNGSISATGSIGVDVIVTYFI